MDNLMRYAHCEGHTGVTYDNSGRYIITCGTDGEVRVFDGIEDDDPQTHHMGGIVNSIAFKNDLLYIASNMNTVLAYTFPDIACDGTILQFSTAVFDISCSNSGKFIAAGGGDFIVKVYNKDTKSSATCTIHEAPILSLAFDPEDKYLASSSCDGTVRIAQLTDYKCIKTLNLIKKSNDFCNSETLCRLQWHPNKGQFLVIPVEMELKFYDPVSWDCLFTLQDESINQVLSIAVFSPCGNYVAASSNNGVIVVWDVNKKKCVGKKDGEKQNKICGMAWNPSSKKEIAFTDVEGQLGVFDEFTTSRPTTTTTTTIPSLADRQPTASFTPNDSQSAAPEEENNSMNMDFQSFGHQINEGDDDSALDIGAMKAKWEPKIFGTTAEEPAPVAVTTPIVEKQPEIPVTSIQVSFQPSSTPLHLDNRFMVWNSVGIVRCYNTEEENSIDLEFHNASVHHPIYVNNIHNFTMASLSVEALLLASSKTEDTGSKLQCHHFGTWDSNKEWTFEIDRDEEEIEAITLGNGWAAVATNLKLLRLFSISGLQCEIMCIPGPVVCLAASGMLLAVAYHRGPGLVGEQNLGLLHINVNLKANSSCRDVPLPLSTKSFLSWMGYSDEEQLCTVDTSGQVRLLCSGYAKWIPIANTKSHVKGKSDSFFVVGLSELTQELRCILCKGAHYPSLLPRPVVTALPFCLPFIGMTTDKSHLEEEKQRLFILQNRVKSLSSQGFNLDDELTSTENKLGEILLKSFALALKNSREYRAFDIAEYLMSSQVIQGAIRYATQKHHMGLAKRLGESLHKRIMEENGGFEDESEMEEEIIVPTVTDPKSLRHLKSKEVEKEILQPKELTLKRRSAFKKDTQEQLDNGTSEKEENSSSFSHISLLPNSSPAINPFKIQSKPENADKQSNNKMNDKLRECTNSVANSEKKCSRQRKLFEKDSVSVKEIADVPSTPPKFGFALFLEENKEQLKTENPDVEDSEIAKLAAKQFRSLSAEEKEKYKSRPSSESSASSKRKVEDTDKQECKKSKTNDELDSPNIFNKFKRFSFNKKSA